MKQYILYSYYTEEYDPSHNGVEIIGITDDFNKARLQAFRLFEDLKKETLELDCDEPVISEQSDRLVIVLKSIFRTDGIGADYTIIVRTVSEL